MRLRIVAEGYGVRNRHFGNGRFRLRRFGKDFGEVFWPTEGNSRIEAQQGTRRHVGGGDDKTHLHRCDTVCKTRKSSDVTSPHKCRRIWYNTAHSNIRA